MAPSKEVHFQVKEEQEDPLEVVNQQINKLSEELQAMEEETRAEMQEINGAIHLLHSMISNMTTQIDKMSSSLSELSGSSGRTTTLIGQDTKVSRQPSSSKDKAPTNDRFKVGDAIVMTEKGESFRGKIIAIGKNKKGISMPTIQWNETKERTQVSFKLLKRDVSSSHQSKELQTLEEYLGIPQ